MTKRAEKVAANYRLEKVGGLWVATNEHYGYSPATRIVNVDRDFVRREARCQWGHFNHEDEARAFNAIFG